MFRKSAAVSSLGAASVKRGLGDRAEFIPENRHASAPSAYLDDGSRKISVGDLLAKVADTYKVSANPSDYLFEAIRANTTNPPNENNDGFHQSELLRFDLRVGMPVYQTYSGKPHHVDHKTADPTRAKGVIIDTTYNDRAPALEHCPRCTLKTAERENRDATGLHCKRCGQLVRDEFVEILVGVDTKKDPVFAQGVKSGQLNTGSMGCGCLNTRCNVCGHIAYNEREFCAHVKAGSKGSLWLRDRDEWRKVSAVEARRGLERVGYRWDPVDFCYATAPGFELRKGFEYCESVIFDEYSRVPQPADPKARQREVLRAASLDPQQENTMPKKFTVIRIDRDPDDLWAAASLVKAAAKAVVTAENHIEVMEVEAADERAALHLAAAKLQESPKAARALTATEKAAIGVAGDIEVEVSGVPPDETVALKQKPAKPAPAAPAAPAAPELGIEELQDESAPDEAALSAPEMGMGMKPPGASKRPFAKAYAAHRVETTKVGNVRVVDDRGRAVLLIPALALQKKSGSAGVAKLAARVSESLLEQGLVATAKAFRGVFSRAGDVVDGAVDDMKEFADKQLYGSTRDNIEDATDMQTGRADPPASTRDRAADDMEPERSEPPASTLEGGAADHDRDEAAPASALEGTQSDMQRKREPKRVTDSTSEGGSRDFNLKAALAKYDERSRRAWATREAKLKAAHAAEVQRETAAVREAAVAGYQRALRLAAARQVSGLEASPMRSTAEQLLATARPIGQDASYEGMVPELARYLAAEMLVAGHAEHLEHLMARAASLLEMGDRYLLDAERDAQQFTAALPPVTAAALLPVDPVEAQAAAYRQAAVQGNLPVVSSASTEQGGHDKRAAIQRAVSGTDLGLRLQALARAVN